MLANLIVDLLVAKVALDPDAGCRKPGLNLLRIVVGIGHNRRHHCLHRREPDRQAAREMLDQDADETLVAAKIARCSMTGRCLSPSSPM